MSGEDIWNLGYLVAANASVDFICTIFLGFFHKFWIGEEWSSNLRDYQRRKRTLPCSPCLHDLREELNLQPEQIIGEMIRKIHRVLVSITSGVLILLVVTKGILTDPLRREVTQTKAPRGTMVAIVGIRASCHPMPFKGYKRPLRKRWDLY